MAIIDREPLSISAQELETFEDLTRPERPNGPFPLSGPGRVLLAALSAGAGAIHLVMVPSHASEWLPEGIAFALAGWLQIGLAIAIIARPSRTALRVSCLANVVFIAAWVVSRIWGLPFGPEAGEAHAASFVDITCVALEAVLVIAGYELLAHPERGSRLPDSARAILTIVPLGILVLTTAAIASPSAAGHAHDEHGSTLEAGGHSHGAADPSAVAGVGLDGVDHSHDAAGAAPAAPADDKGLSKVMNGQGEGGGHVHDTSVVPVDAATQAQLDAQLAATKPLIEKYPTVAAAEAAGYYRQGPFAPGLGAHYMGPNTKVGLKGTLEGEDFLHPTLIYDGIAPDSKLAGFMYNIFSTDTEHAPEGFAGPNDHWHYHTNVCIVPRPGGGIDAPLGADTSASKELCDQYGGRLIANTGYMVHVWTVPGYESPQGLFSNLNTRITCPNGTYYIVTPEETGRRSNICKDVPA